MTRIYRDRDGNLVKVRFTETGWLLSYRHGPTVSVGSKAELESVLKGNGPR